MKFLIFSVTHHYPEVHQPTEAKGAVGPEVGGADPGWHIIETLGHWFLLPYIRGLYGRFLVSLSVKAQRS
jgi:hypothetical protein